MLLTAAVTYRGLCLVMPGERVQRAMEPTLDRIASVQAQVQAAPIPHSIVEAIPLQTQVVHSSRWSTKRTKMVPAQRLRDGKPRAEAAPMDLSPIPEELPAELKRRLELGL